MSIPQSMSTKHSVFDVSLDELEEHLNLDLDPAQANAPYPRLVTRDTTEGKPFLNELDLPFPALPNCDAHQDHGPSSSSATSMLIQGDAITDGGDDDDGLHIQMHGGSALSGDSRRGFGGSPYASGISEKGDNTESALSGYGQVSIHMSPENDDELGNHEDILARRTRRRQEHDHEDSGIQLRTLTARTVSPVSMLRGERTTPRADDQNNVNNGLKVEEAHNNILSSSVAMSTLSTVPVSGLSFEGGHESSVSESETTQARKGNASREHGYERETIPDDGTSVDTSDSDAALLNVVSGLPGIGNGASSHSTRRTVAVSTRHESSQIPSGDIDHDVTTPFGLLGLRLVSTFLSTPVSALLVAGSLTGKAYRGFREEVSKRIKLIRGNHGIQHLDECRQEVLRQLRLSQQAAATNVVETSKARTPTDPHDKDTSRLSYCQRRLLKYNSPLYFHIAFLLCYVFTFLNVVPQLHPFSWTLFPSMVSLSKSP